MRNCLVTKLKASVENNALEKFGFIRILIGGAGIATNAYLGVKNRIFVYDENFSIVKQQDNHGEEIQVNVEIPSNTTYYVDLEVDGFYRLRGSFLIMQSLNISKFKYCTSLKEFEPNSSNLEGDIVELSKLVSLTSIRLNENINVYGSIESLVEGLRKGGKVNGTLTIGLKNTKVTFNSNKPINDELTVEFSDGSCVVKSSGSVIGTYNGTSWSYN